MSLAKDKKNHKVYRVAEGKPRPIIYKDPTTHSAIVKKLPANTRWIIKLPGEKKYTRVTWLHVSWNNKVGWIMKTQLIYDEKATTMARKNPRCLYRKTRVKSCNTG